jgi:hypothetical protein
MSFVRRDWWIVLAILALVAFVSLALPIYVIRPFRPQGATELAVALVVRRWGPGIAVLCALAALGLLIYLWEDLRNRKRRTLAALATFITCLFATLAHVNIYELMFHPAGAPGFTSAAEAQVEPDDMVLTVKINGDARAYPIRTMGYHHIINDWVGGAPIAVTY